MPRRRFARPAAMLAASLVATVAVVVPAPVALADEATDAPVTQPDRVTFRGGGEAASGQLRGVHR